MINFPAKFEAGLEYDAFLKMHGTTEHRARWTEVHRQCRLTDAQHALFPSFVRDMKVLCLAGAWCGDCVRQCPIFDHFARISSKIHVRFIDRDADADLANELRVCGGSRVPVVALLSEDFFECARYGDRTISRCRELAAQLGGAACSTDIISDASTLNAAIDDWIREFERVQHMLRLSPRLRQRHGD
jgi:hypothetical protein